MSGVCETLTRASEEKDRTIRTGGLAQLGERLLCTQEVSGSIPLSSTSSVFADKLLFFTSWYFVIISWQNEQSFCYKKDLAVRGSLS